MKKFLIVFKVCAVFALAGLFHCAVIEQAYACTESSSATHQEKDMHCCVVCHPTHHQWTKSGSFTWAGEPDGLQRFGSKTDNLKHLVLVQSIFHPPKITS